MTYVTYMIWKEYTNAQYKQTKSWRKERVLSGDQIIMSKELWSKKNAPDKYFITKNVGLQKFQNPRSLHFAVNQYKTLVMKL